MADTPFDASTSVPPSTGRPGRGPRDRARLIAGALAAVVIAAIGFLLFGSTGSNLSSPIAQAATLSSNAPGYRVHMSASLSASVLSSPITITGTAIVDPRDHASTASIEMSLPNDPQVTQALGGSTIRMDTIVDGTAVYAKLPSALTATLPMSGKDWLKIDLAKFTKLPGLSSLPTDPTSSDPSQFLRYLRSVSAGVVTEGQEVVDGLETTHYRAAVSLQALASSLPSAEQQSFEKALSEFGQSSPDFVIDAWVDGQHLVRRMVLTITLSAPNGASVREVVRADLSDYGPQPKPTLPPAADVQDLNALAGVTGA
jgi:hypothetical protein